MNWFSEIGMKFPVVASYIVSRTTVQDSLDSEFNVSCSSFFKIALAIVGPSNSHINFRNSLSVSTTK